jgi:hypothetical protein
MVDKIWWIWTRKLVIKIIIYRVFESAPKDLAINLVDKTFFWTSLMAGSGVWLVFLILNLISFKFF